MKPKARYISSSYNCDCIQPAIPERNVISLEASLVVQWLRFCAPNAGGLGLIPGQGTRFHMLQLRSCVPQLRPGTAKKKKYIYIYTVTLVCSYYHIHRRNSFHIINLKLYQLNNNTPFSSHSILWQPFYFVFTFLTTLSISYSKILWYVFL